MELDITHFFNEADPFDYSASVAERGENAAFQTWNAALVDAELNSAWLDGDDAREVIRDFFRGFGAWEKEQIDGWSDRELTALLMQFIAGDIREASLDAIVPDWEEYARDCEEGRVSGRIFRSGDRVFYYIGD